MARNGTRLADNSLRCIALPPGAGGRSEGLSEAGFYSLFAAEIVPTYAKTYAFNHSGAKVTIADIRTLDAEDIRKGLEIEKGSLDQIAGGPPHQGFSINAPMRSTLDERNHLFKNYLRFVAFRLNPLAPSAAPLSINCQSQAEACVLLLVRVEAMPMV